MTSRPAAPPLDSELQALATGLPDGWALTRSVVGGVVLHRAAVTPAPPRFRRPVGPALTIVVDDSIAQLGTATNAQLDRIAGFLATVPGTYGGIVVRFDSLGLGRPIAQPRLVDITNRLMSGVHQLAFLAVPADHVTASDTVEPQVVPIDNDPRVTFPSLAVEYLVSPLVRPGTALTPYGWDAPAPTAPAAVGSSRAPDLTFELPEGWQAAYRNGELSISHPNPGVTSIPEPVQAELGRILRGLPLAHRRRVRAPAFMLDAPEGYVSVSAPEDGLPHATIVQLREDEAELREMLQSARALPPSGRPLVVVAASMTTQQVVNVLAKVGAGVDVHVAGLVGDARAHQDFTALADALAGYLPGVMTVQATLVTDRPPDWVRWRPLDAQHAVTFAPWATHFAIHTTDQPEQAPYDLAMIGPNEYELDGWRVTVDTTDNHVVVAPAGFTTTGTHAGPGGRGRAISVAMPTGNPPFSVQDLVARIAAGQAPNDVDVQRLDDALTATKPAATSEPAPTPVDPGAVPPREALGVSAPRGTLPVEPLVAQLREAFARHGVTEAEWQALPAKLLNNYRYVVSGGFPLKLGRAEVLISLDPKHPIKVTNPGASYDSIVLREEQEPENERLDRAKPENGKKPDDATIAPFHSVESTQGSFRIGGRGQKESGRTANTHVKLNLAFLFSLVAGVPLPGGFGLGPSLTVNQSNRTSGSVTDAERGRVLDTRAPSTLFGYRDPGWRVQFRTDSLAWQEVDLTGMSTEPLVVWVQDHFLGERPDQVRATGLIEGREQEFPDAYYATPINLTPFYDAVLTTLKEAGVDISLHSGVREELRTKLWNLEVNLDLAINGYARTHPVGGGENLADLFLDGGYTFILHNLRTGHVVAAVAVQARRVNSSVGRIGTTSDKAHIEEVRTAISGEATGHTLSSSTGLELSGSASKPEESEEDGSSSAAFLPSGALTGTRENKDSISAGGTGLFVLVHRRTGYTVGMLTALLLKAFVDVRGGTRRVETNWEPGQFMVRLTEPDAFEYGFPVDRDAIVDKRRISGGTVPYGPDVVRHKAATGDTSWGRLPDYLTKGPRVGLGAAMVKLSRPEIRRIAKAVADHLRDAGFLPDLDQPFTPTGPAVARDSRLQNLEAFWEAFQPGSFEVHAFQGYFEIEFLLMTGTGEPRRVRLRFYLATDLSNALDRNGNSIYSVLRTFDNQFVILLMAMGLTGRSIEGGTRLDGRFTGNVLDNAGLGASGSRSLSAAAHVREVGNFPVLLEAMGPHVFYLPSDGATGSGDPDGAPLRVTGYAQYSDVGPGEYGWTPMTRILGPTPVSAVLYLLPQLANGSRTTATVPTPTPAWVFDTAGVIYTDATALGTAVERVFREHNLAGVGQPGHTAIKEFLSPISIYSFFSQIVRGAYTTDGPFNPGVVRTTYGGLAVGAEVGASAFLGRLGDRPTLGIIELFLKQIRTGAASNWGAGVQLSGLFAGLLRGATADWLDGTSVQAGFVDRLQIDGESTGGKEDIKLSFGPLLIFSAPVTYTLDWGVELRGKLGGSSGWDAAEISHDSEVVYLLSEPDGLAAYGKGVVPLSEEVLNDALSRWVANELQLTGDVVATVLVRWFTDTQDRERVQFQRLQIHAWAEELRDRHAAGTAVMLDDEIVRNFNKAFGFDIDDTKLESPYAGLYIPPNLQGPNPQLGHAAVDRIELRDQAPDRTPLATARRLIRRIAPGLLTERELLGVPRVGVFYERWLGGRWVIGRLQGGLRTLELLLAGTRLHQLADSLLQPGGTTFYLTNQVGYFLTTVVALNISGSTSPLQYGHYHAGTGLETYLHNYRVMATSQAKSFVLDGSASVDPPYGGGVSAAGTPGTATGTSRTVSRSEQTTEYYTAYDWGGHYDLVGDLLLTFSVRQLGLENKPINNLLAGQTRRQAAHVEAENLPARLVLRLPKALAHAAPVHGPARAPSFTPVVLPPDIFVLSWDVNALPEAERFLQKVFARRTKWGQLLFPEQTYNRRVRPPEAWETQLSRTVLTPKLHTATPDPALPGSDRAGYQLGTVHRPGHFGDRAEVWLSGSVWGPQIIAILPEGTGMGFYGKDSIATTREGSGSRWRFNFGLSTSRVTEGFSGVLHSLTVPGLSTTIGNPLADAASHTVANRPENHVKQQGPVVLVRLRGVFTLKAQRDHTLFLPVDGDMHVSDPFSGDIVVEMFADEAQRLLDLLGKQQLAAAASATSTDAPDVPADAPNFDLVVNLARAAADETVTAFDAAGKVASRVMEDIRALPVARRGTAAEAIVLTADDDARTRLTYLPFIQWARDYLRDVTAWLRANGDTTTVPDAVSAVPAWVDSWNPDEPPSLAQMRSRLRQAYEAVAAVDYRATALAHDQRRPAIPERRKPPRLVPILGVDPVYAAQQIANETGRVVELRVTEEGAATSYYRFDSSGRMWQRIGPDFVQLDPATQDAFAWNELFTADHLNARIDLYDVLAQVIARGQTAERALGWLTRRVLRALADDSTRSRPPTLEMFGDPSSVYRAATVWARRQGGRLQTLANVAQGWAESATQDEMLSRLTEVLTALPKLDDATHGLTGPGDPSPGELRAMATLLAEPWVVARQLATAIQGTVVMRVPDTDGRTCTARTSRSGAPPERVEGIDLYRELADVANGLEDPFTTLDQAESAAKARLHNRGRDSTLDTLSLVADARSRLLALYYPARDLARQRLTSNPDPEFADILAWPDGEPDDVALRERAFRLNAYFGALPVDTDDPDMARLMLTHRLMKRNPLRFAEELANWLGETVHLHEVSFDRDRYTTEFESAGPTADPPEDRAEPIDLYRLVDSLARPDDGGYAPAVQRAVDELARGTAYRFVASQPELYYRIAVHRAAELADRGTTELDAAVAWRRDLASGRLPRRVVLKSRLTWLADRIGLYADPAAVEAINRAPRAIVEALAQRRGDLVFVDIQTVDGGDIRVEFFGDEMAVTT